MNKFLDIIKVFLEKHFLPALAAVVLSGITFFFTPEDFSFLLKLEKWLYLFVIFAFYMLVIELVIKFIKFVQQKTKLRKEEKEYNDNIAKENEKFLLDTVDSLPIEDRRKLDYFMKHNNEPLITTMRIYESIFLEQFCDVNEFETKEAMKVRNPFTLKKDIELQKGSRAIRYRLKDSIYEELKYLEKKYGKVSRF